MQPSGQLEAPLSNADFAELLANEAETAKFPLQRALRRAARRAFLWEEEATALAGAGRSLTELEGIGPSLEKMLLRWMEDRPAMPRLPEIRSGFLTLAEARTALRSDPSFLSGIKGDLQMHSEWSDGSASIEDMARGGAECNYEYIAVTDHSKGLKIAGGIDEGQLVEQGSEIAAVNASLKKSSSRLRVLRSIELNLSPNGDGDMEARSLATLDIVLGCFHSSLRKKEDQTDRYIAALRNPTIQILGHPRGRIYNYRLGLTADWSKVFDTAAELNKAVEIDGYPDRQDLNVDLLRLAKKSGCRISLGTDSHGPTQLRFIEFSAAAALLAGIKRERILNFLPRKDLLSWVESVRSLPGKKVKAAAARSQRSGRR